MGRTYMDGEKCQALNCNALERGRFYEERFFDVAEANARDYKVDVSIEEAGR